MMTVEICLTSIVIVLMLISIVLLLVGDYRVRKALLDATNVNQHHRRHRRARRGGFKV